MSTHEKESSATDEPILWCYEHLENFSPPRATAQETVRKGLFGLFERLWGSSEPHKNMIVQEDLQQLPSELCEQVTPKLDWKSTSSAFDVLLKDWREKTIDHHKPLLTDKVQMIINSPYSGVAEALSHWAKTYGLQLVQPPTTDDIFTNNEGWLAQLTVNPTDKVWVVPALEQCYYRHAAGLGLIRQMLSHIMQYRCRWVIGCSSWAWIYLNNAINIGMFFPKPWALQALAGEQLQHWFGQSIPHNGMPKISFRQADTGAFVITPSTPSDAKAHNDKASNNKDKKKSSFLTDLAAHSRGNPGVALAIWRNSLRQAPDKKEAKEEADDTPSTTAKQKEQTIWVTPWQRVSLPHLHGLNSRRELFVLQTLLIHGKLSLELLIELLPFSPFEVEQTVNYLMYLGVLKNNQECWQVTAMGYPAIRQAMANAGYPLDCL
jgi:hypothetical protein